MHPNALLITGFYEAFARQDPGPMRAVYADDARFGDGAFPDLRGRDIGDMWAMLCERAQGFSLSFRDVQADDAKGSAHWEARYLFGGKRKVHNVIDAAFVFRDGRVVQHTDTFDFYRWSRQALGAAGWLLGWSGFLQRQVQRRSAKLLSGWQRRSA